MSLTAVTEALHEGQHLGAVAVPERLVDPMQQTDRHGRIVSPWGNT